MVLNLHNFLYDQPGYGEGKSSRITTLLDEQLKETMGYLFGRSEGFGGGQSAK